MMLEKLNNLQQRLLMSTIGVVLLVIVLYMSQESFFKPIFVFLTAAVTSSALYEYYKIGVSLGYQPLKKIGIIGTFFYAFAIFLKTLDPSFKLLPPIVLALILIASFMYFFAKGAHPLVNIAITLFGILYLTVTLSCIIEITYFPDHDIVRDGRYCLVYLLLVTKMTDTAAFFVGKKMGKIQLSSYISPKKTLEGSLGGFCGALATSVILYVIFNLFFETPPFELTFFEAIWLAFLISLTAQFGDLAESLLKRDAGVKDSSKLPGLGGMLDVLDSLVFTSPLMYIFLNLK